MASSNNFAAQGAMEQLLDDAARRLRESIEPLLSDVEPQAIHANIEKAIAGLAEEGAIGI